LTEHRITDVRQSKRVANRYSVYIDSKFAFSAHFDEIHALNIRKGRLLTGDELSELTDYFSERKLRETAFRILSYRPRSEQELRNKLREKRFPDSDIEDIIREFRDKKLLSDTDFARQWVENRMRLKPRGRKMLEMELYKKGVSRQTANRVLDDILGGTDQSETAFELLIKQPRKFLRENSVDTQRKIYNYLRYRGFDPDDIRRAAERFITETAKSED